MIFSKVKPNESIALFVKDILVFDETNNPENTVLPFFADGYPGFLFHITPNGQLVQPQNKKMPVTYLHGQTLHPVELHMQGNFKIVSFQLYPFVINSLFNVNAKELNNGCYDLCQIEEWKPIEKALLNLNDTEKQVSVISDFLLKTFNKQKDQLDLQIKDAIQIILAQNALITVQNLSEQLHMTIRTLERRFIKQVGISVKDFIQTIKFQQSYEQLSSKDYKKLTDIVFSNGFADQSHFIRVFKAFTGKTPSKFK